MMQLTSKTVLRATVSAAFLFSIVAPIHAQGIVASGAGLLDRGSHGRSFAFAATRSASGEVQGAGEVHVHNIASLGEAFIRIDITSMAHDSAGDLIDMPSRAWRRATAMILLSRRGASRSPPTR